MNQQTIPGTNYPFKVHERKGPPKLKNSTETKQRRGLLAKIHIAQDDLLLTKAERENLRRAFHVASFADATIPQLEKAIKLLKSFGWKDIKGTSEKGKNPDQLVALRSRCVEEASGIYNGEKRMAGLALKICGTSQLVWCRDVSKLEGLLAALRKIKMDEGNKHEI